MKLPFKVALFLFFVTALSSAQTTVSNGGSTPGATTNRVISSTMDGNFSAINDAGCGGWTDQGSGNSGGPQINAPFVNGFGNREVRVTDGCIPGGAYGADGWGGPNLGWWQSYWSVYDSNVGGYYFFQQLDDASLNGVPGYRLFTLNPQTMTTSPVCNTWTNCVLPHEGGFSYVTPGLMYYVVGSTGNICSYNYDSLSGNGTCSDGVGTLVYNMDSCPSLSGVTGWGDITISHNDQTFQIHTSSISAVYSTAYSKCYWTNPETNQVGGTDNPTPITGNMSAWPSGIGFHDSVLNPSGQFVWWAPNNGANNTWIWQVYDSSGNETTTAPQCTAQSSFCLGHISLGYSHLVFKADNPQGTPFNASVPSAFDWGIVPLSAPTSYTHVYPTSGKRPQYNPYQGPYFATPSCVSSDSHSTWNQVNPTDTTPLVVSNFNDGQIGSSTPTSISCPWDREIVAISMDGSGTTYRLAHNWATGQQNPLAGFDSQYNALSMPICSPDGKYCLWQTDWNSSLGTMLGNVSNTYGCSGAYGCNWHQTTTYTTGQEVIDSNGNEEDATTGGTSGSAVPSWPITSGGTVVDGTVHWTNHPGCNTSETTSSLGTCRVDIFVVEAKSNPPTVSGATLFSTVQAPASPNNGSSGTGLTTATAWYSDANGVVTGETAYRGTDDTGTWTAAIWDSSCNLLASAPFTTSAPGWQTATFSTPVPIQADQIYLSGHFSSENYYADTSDGQTGTGGMSSFTSSQWDNPPLHALKNGSSPLGNGRYVYASSMTCPSGGSWSGDNYSDGPVFVASGRVPTPQLLSLSPSSFSTAGGVSISVAASNLAPSATIQIGGANATVQWNSPTSATVTLPAGAAGPTYASVQNASLVSTTLQNAGTYTSTAPTVTGVNPSSCVAAGGCAETISGSGFVSGATVTIGSGSCTNVSVSNSGSLACTAPSGTAGTYGTVTVTDSNGSGSLADGLYWSGALLTGMTPANYTLPSGWTLVDANNFSNGFHAGESAFGGNTTEINCSFGHAGNCSLDSHITQSFAGYGMLLNGNYINSREVYVSYWMYVSNSNPGYGFDYTNWYHLVRAPQSEGVGYGLDMDFIPSSPPNCWYACIGGSAAPFGNNANGPDWGDYATWYNQTPGQWYQFEFLVKANTPGGTDGDIQYYVNGTSMAQCSAANNCPYNGGGAPGNLVGNDDYTTANLYVGGDWGANMWYGNAAHTTYSTSGDLGYGGANANMTACQDTIMCPPNGTIPYFDIYITDVIILKQ
jgi:hypothetical protein